MKIYIDNDYKCHASNNGTKREFEVPFFDGKCTAFIEGYRYVPQGETWTRSDGVQFRGEMISPWKDYNILAAAQAQYEAMLAEQKDMQTALETLGVTVNG